MERDYRHAEEDLSRSLDIRANDALCAAPPRLRPHAPKRVRSCRERRDRRRSTLEPTNVDALLMLGHTRESKRTGTPVED
ncbi:MAG: hypothetical protein WDM79_12290 [Terricaulis sp.]